eukprot:GEMP01045119.1.p1 GENE.GEMP01045119.1~~GEMP01045119.1.p1  ORF type:complete len:376 (+),score=38.52 GEMP01045119.1:129-1256(+)
MNISLSQVSALAIVGLLIFQLLVLYQVLSDISPTVATIFAVADCYHIIYYVTHIPLSEADSAGPTLWMGYSWLIAGKWFLIYVNSSDKWQSLTVVGANLTVRLAFSSVPLMYLLLMFRATKPLFTSMSNTITPDVMMHYEMFWTVFIDLYDIVSANLNSAFADSVGSSRQRQAILAYAWAITLYHEAAALILFVGLLCHGQSFPGAEWQLPAIEKKTYQKVQEDIDENILYREKDYNKGYRDFISQLDVTYSRERSALVSVFIVNMPLFFIRLYLMNIIKFTGVSDSNNILLLLKNLAFFLFQFLQLRIVMRRRRELISRYMKMSVEQNGVSMPCNSGIIVDTVLFVLLGFVFGTLMAWQADIISSLDGIYILFV